MTETRERYIMYIKWILPQLLPEAIIEFRVHYETSIMNFELLTFKHQFIKFLLLTNDAAWFQSFLTLYPLSNITYPICNLLNFSSSQVLRYNDD